MYPKDLKLIGLFETLWNSLVWYVRTYFDLQNENLIGQTISDTSIGVCTSDCNCECFLSVHKTLPPLKYHMSAVRFQLRKHPSVNEILQLEERLRDTRHPEPLVRDNDPNKDDVLALLELHDVHTSISQQDLFGKYLST